MALRRDSAPFDILTIRAEPTRPGMPGTRALFGCSMRTLLLLAVLVLTGCAKTFIPNTDVLDTSENRKVILFCEQYRHAVEEKNVGQLLKLASPAYHRKSVGNSNDEDVDYVSLKEFLTTTFLQTDAIRYEIRYRKVTFEETTHVHVDYTFAASYRVPGVKKE